MSTAGLVFENCYDSERLTTRLLARATQFPGDAQMSNVAVPAAPQSRSSNGAQTSQSSQGQRTGHQRINKVAVLGAGTMGARIAAHFANAGVPCLLLHTVTPDAAQSTDKAARRTIDGA